MHSKLLSILLLLSAAVGGVAVARRFGLPSMLAYLAIGMALGPHGLAMLSETAEVQNFAEFGIVFLMFSIGLEFSIKRLQAMRTLVFGFGSAQLALGAFVGDMLITLSAMLLSMFIAPFLIARAARPAGHTGPWNHRPIFRP